MKKKTIISLLASAALLLLGAAGNPLQADSVLRGRVLCGDEPIEGVKVTDGKNIVLTGADGAYALESDKAYGLVYITPPSGYVPQSADGVKPEFWAALDKASASDETHDFRLQRQDQSSYTVLFLTDVHLCGSTRKPDIEVFRRKALPAFNALAEKASKNGPVYAFNLGDLSHERYWYEFNFGLQDAYNEFLLGGDKTPMYSIPGNHDNDCAVLSDNTDYDAGHIYRSVLGPEYYSVEIGDEHWIFADDIIYINDPTVHKKPWPVGSKGSINYKAGFTPEEMEWIEKDLESVPEGKKVIFCTHCPVLKDGGAETTFPEEQMTRLSKALGRFGSVMIYSGHLHRSEYIVSEKWPLFTNQVLCAFSGDMWESAPNPLLGIEGEDGGVLEVHFTAKGEQTSWQTHLYGEKVMRIYDLNAVRERYSSDPRIRAQIAAFPERTDYADEKFKNRILVNYWMWKPGETVEILEGGKPLKVKKVKWEDPLFNLSYYLPAWENANGVAPGQYKVTNHHSFSAKASSSKSTITVRVLSPEGKVLYKQTLKRPVASFPAKEYDWTPGENLTIIGKLFPDTPNPWHRIDTTRFKGFDPDENLLVRQSSGIALVFRSDSPSIAVRTTYEDRQRKTSTAPIASYGYDLYVSDGKGGWTFADAGVSSKDGKTVTTVLAGGMEPTEKEFLLYLPLYAVLEKIEIGIEMGSRIEAAPSPFRHRVAVFGSSYTHGAGCSRSGMTYAAQLTRNTGIQLLSLGCSGHSKLQPYFADVLAEADVDAILLDAFSNPSAKTIRERLLPFIDMVATAHPDIPIIFQRTLRREERNFRTGVEKDEAEKRQVSDSLMTEVMKKYPNVYFITPSASDGSHLHSVDGVHPDEYGYRLWAESIEKQFKKILKKYKIN